MRIRGWQLFLGSMVLLFAIVISFTVEDPINSQLWSSFSVISAVFTIHHQVNMPKKGKLNES